MTACSKIPSVTVRVWYADGGWSNLRVPDLRRPTPPKVGRYVVPFDELNAPERRHRRGVYADPDRHDRGHVDPAVFGSIQYHGAYEDSWDNFAPDD